jgi:hypothetical protein
MCNGGFGSCTTQNHLQTKQFVNGTLIPAERLPVRWRDSLPIDMLLSAVSVLVVAQSSSKIAEGLMNNPVHTNRFYYAATILTIWTGSIEPVNTLARIW